MEQNRYITEPFKGHDMKIRLSQLRKIINEELRQSKTGQLQEIGFSDIFGKKKKPYEIPTGTEAEVEAEKAEDKKKGEAIMARLKSLPDQVKAAHEEIVSKIEKQLPKEAKNIASTFADDLLLLLLRSDTSYAKAPSALEKFRKKGLEKIFSLGSPGLDENLDLLKDKGSLLGRAASQVIAADAGSLSGAIDNFIKELSSSNEFDKTEQLLLKIDNEETLKRTIQALFGGNIESIVNPAFLKMVDEITPFITAKAMKGGKLTMTNAAGSMSAEDIGKLLRKPKAVDAARGDKQVASLKKDEEPAKEDVKDEEKNEKLMKYFGTTDVNAIRKNIARAVALASSKDSRGKMLRDVMLTQGPKEKREAEELLRKIIVAETRKILKKL